MKRPEKVICTAKVHTTGGRVGSSRSDDGKLDVKLSRPGTFGAGTNPEQLFAAGWSACYQSAMELVARRMNVALSADHAVDAEVDLGPNGAGYDVAVRLNVSLPGVAPDVAQRLIEATHECVRIPGRCTATSRSRRSSCEPQSQVETLRTANGRLWV
jgi:lipoyl-dependent peroxiredoxin